MVLTLTIMLPTATKSHSITLLYLHRSCFCSSQNVILSSAKYYLIFYKELEQDVTEKGSMLKLMGNVSAERQEASLTLMERGMRRAGLGEGKRGRARFTGSHTPVELQ